MSLHGKNVCFVESSALVAENDWMLKHKYKIASYAVYGSLPELSGLQSHDAAVIHLTKETRRVARDLDILRLAFADGYPMAILVSLLTVDDKALYSEIQKMGVKTIEKRALGSHFRDALDYLHEL